jgi:asparagine synthetase B (glutamine-hydrolysing)
MMCGFVAFLQDMPIIDMAHARRSLVMITHCGSDAAGEWQERDVLLLHCRLTIIASLTSPRFIIPAKQGWRYVIVFNLLFPVACYRVSIEVPPLTKVVRGI